MFVVLSNFPEPFFYLCGENYVCDTDESLLHKNSFFERARLLFSISAIEKQPTSLQNYQKNLKMHLNLVKIRKPVVTQFFWAKDFCNRLLQKTFAKQPNGHIKNSATHLLIGWSSRNLIAMYCKQYTSSL